MELAGRWAGKQKPLEQISYLGRFGTGLLAGWELQQITYKPAGNQNWPEKAWSWIAGRLETQTGWNKLEQAGWLPGNRRWLERIHYQPAGHQNWLDQLWSWIASGLGAQTGWSKIGVSLLAGRAITAWLGTRRGWSKFGAGMLDWNPNWLE